jgi:hypothetical protein
MHTCWFTMFHNNWFFRVKRFLVALGFTAVLLACLAILFPSPPESQENILEAITVGRPASAGQIFDECSLYVAYHPVSDIRDGVYEDPNDDTGKIARFEVEVGTIFADMMLLDEWVADILVSVRFIAEGSLITESEVQVITLTRHEIGKISERELLKSFDYYYLGQIRAKVDIEPGQLLSRDLVSFEPVDDYHSIVGYQPTVDTFISFYVDQVLPPREQVLEIAHFSAQRFILVFLVGIGFTLLLSLLLRGLRRTPISYDSKR